MNFLPTLLNKVEFEREKLCSGETAGRAGQGPQAGKFKIKLVGVRDFPNEWIGNSGVHLFFWRSTGVRPA